MQHRHVAAKRDHGTQQGLALVLRESLVARRLDHAQFLVDPVKSIVNLFPLRQQTARLVEHPHDQRLTFLQRQQDLVSQPVHRPHRPADARSRGSFDRVVGVQIRAGRHFDQVVDRDFIERAFADLHRNHLGDVGEHRGLGQRHVDSSHGARTDHLRRFLAVSELVGKLQLLHFLLFRHRDRQHDIRYGDPDRNKGHQ